jgi:hypothetical protein
MDERIACLERAQSESLARESCTLKLMKLQEEEEGIAQKEAFYLDRAAGEKFQQAKEEKNGDNFGLKKNLIFFI